MLRASAVSFVTSVAGIAAFGEDFGEQLDRHAFRHRFAYRSSALFHRDCATCHETPFEQAPGREHWRGIIGDYAMRGLSRRQLALTAGAGVVGATVWSAMPARQQGGSLGSITGNDPSGFGRFATWLGRKPELAQLYFNQTGTTQLAESIDFECDNATKFMALGAKIYWSVPTPGARQLEAIVAGTHDALYGRLFKRIVAAEGAGNASILVRLPWEFNLAEQENAARDQNGNWNAALFVAAWQHLAKLARVASPRFRRVWCPNVGRHGIDPELCWPGADHVEIVAQDFYLQTRYDPPGTFFYFRNSDRGLGWGTEFARRFAKPYGLSEWGMDSDRYAADLAATGVWLAGLGSQLHHFCWWDRPEGIDCRISDGSHALLGKTFRTEFGRSTAQRLHQT